MAVDVAPHRGLGAFHPALLQQLVDHQEAVAFPAPSRTLVSASVKRVVPAILAAAVLVIPLTGRLSTRRKTLQVLNDVVI